MDLRITEKKDADGIASSQNSMDESDDSLSNIKTNSFTNHRCAVDPLNTYQEPSSSHLMNKYGSPHIEIEKVRHIKNSKEALKDKGYLKDSKHDGVDISDDSSDQDYQQFGEDLSKKTQSMAMERTSQVEDGSESSIIIPKNSFQANLKLFPCPCCPYKANNPSRVKKHIVAKHTTVKLFQCPYCDYKTTHSGSLKPHVMAKHTNEKPHKCNYCEYRATTSSAVKAHIRGKHTNEKPHQCPYCDYKVAQACNLKRHIVHRHSDEKPHQCPHCVYSAKATRTLRAHIMAKHSYDKAQVQCPHCDHMAATPYALRIHTMAVHLDIRPHACPHCRYRASQPGNLQRHLSTKHEHLQL